ncbi:dimethylaniline monooxygenase [Echria macrotheca]|uniref:Dimethylaniline monooxygenase n=1 Tax=Echria macrotheca TaxID=438768 RepID=A0AAJ0B4E5_9PEZI|nr:dimethylaniline monooxygenase [Echria macrotheca]
MKVAIIGAGPSGLVTLKYLLAADRALGTEPVEVKLFEAEDAVGGTFYARMYEDGELVSSKQLTCFSDFRAGHDEPDFLSAKRYLEYLNEYCEEFRLMPYIHLSTKVVSITRGRVPKAPRHIVTYQTGATGEEHQWECDAVAVCAGLHVTPNIPEIPGIENIPFRIHSSEFKSRSQFGVDRTVMVMGGGETASDVAYLAVTASTKRVIMSHRYGFHFAPKRNLNPALFPIFGGKPGKELTIPLDNARASLFDTSYVHPLLRDSMALWVFYNRYVRGILWLTTGTPGGYDQLVGEPDKEYDHVSRMFFNKSNKVAAYVSAPYRKTLNRGIIQRIRSAVIQVAIPDTGGRQVDLAPWPERINPDGTVVFRPTGRPEYERLKHEEIKPDMVVFCTGYRQEFPFFAKQNASDKGRPYRLANETNVRGIWHRDDPTVGFIGFLRPNLGAIPPLAEMQAQLWVLHLLAPSRIPKPLHPRDEPHFRLHHPDDSRIHYGVDHESYVYQLALDMNSALGVWDVLMYSLRGSEGAWKMPLVWAFGSNLNARFRVRGPWKWDGAEEIMKGEMWETMKRRRWFFTISDIFFLTVLPMSIFGPASLVCWIYATIYWVLFGVEPGYGGYDCYGNKLPSNRW